MARTTNILIFTAFLLCLTTSTYSDGLSQGTDNLPSQFGNGKGRGLRAKRTWIVSKPLRSRKKMQKERVIKATGSETTMLPTPSKKYCVPKPNVDDKILQANIDWGCQIGVDCDPLVNTKEVSCSDKSLWIKAAYVMNYFFNANARNESTCDFNNTGFLTLTNPSDGKCAFI